MKQIMIDVDRCVGCLTCTLACSAAHSTSKDIVGAMLEKVPSRIWVFPVKTKVVPHMCRHCEEPACVEACMTGAMQKDPITGIVTNEGNEQTCIGCWMCVMACPYGAVTQHPFESVALKCDRCKGRDVPACVESCPEQALRFVDVDEFAGERARKTVSAFAVGQD